jgi:hypothetical protein
LGLILSPILLLCCISDNKLFDILFVLWFGLLDNNLASLIEENMDSVDWGIMEHLVVYFRALSLSLLISAKSFLIIAINLGSVYKFYLELVELNYCFAPPILDAILVV